MSTDTSVIEALTREPVTWQVEQADLIRYSAVSRDFNAIHYDEAAAQAAGFPRPIAHGMLNLGLVLSRVADACGIAAVRASYTRFRAPAPVGARLTLRFTVDGEHGPATGLHATVENDDAQPVLTSHVEIGSPTPGVPEASAAAEPVGELVAERSFVVEQGPATRFAGALGARAEEFHRKDTAEAAGHPSIPVVPTFGFALPSWGFFPELPGNEHAEMPDALRDCQTWSRTDRAVIHAGQEFHHDRPVYVGETLRARSFVTDRSAKSRGERVLRFTTVVTHFTDDSGAPVLRSGMALVVAE